MSYKQKSETYFNNNNPLEVDSDITSTFGKYYFTIGQGDTETKITFENIKTFEQFLKRLNDKHEYIKLLISCEDDYVEEENE